MKRVRAISINSDVYCMDYGAIKSNKNGKFVMIKVHVLSRQKEKIIHTKLSVKFELSRQFVETIRLDNLSRQLTIFL